MNTFIKLLVLVFFVLPLVGCDKNKNERISLENELSKNKEIISSLQEELKKVEAEDRNNQSQLSDIAYKIDDSNKKIKSKTTELKEFSMENKATIAALMATTTSVAALMNRDIRESLGMSKGTLQMTFAIGAIYCLTYSNECKSVLSTITSLGADISLYQESLGSLDNDKIVIDNKILDANKRRNEITNKIKERETNLFSLNKRINDLKCGFCIF